MKILFIQEAAIARRRGARKNTVSAITQEQVVLDFVGVLIA